MTIFMSSLGFTCLYFLFLLVFALTFNKLDCDSGEETYFALRIIHVFIHVVDIQTLFL